MSCSEGGSKSALGEGPKVFMLAMATSFKVIRSYSESPARVAALAGTVFYFLLLLLGIILISDKDNA